MTTAEILKLDGINAKGFGRIPKTIMQDTSITIESKAIYAYLSSFSGGGTSAFPSREKILAELDISKNRYYKHFNQLIDKGYITVKKKITRNVYLLSSNPKCLLENSAEIQSGNDILITSSSLLSNGFGTIAKLVMQDERLSIIAKGIYCLFSSYAGNGSTAFPTRQVILFYLGLSINTYYKHLQLLLDCGYLTVEQRNSTQNGRFIRNIYTLIDNPTYKTIAPCHKFKDISVTDKSTTTAPCIKNEDISKKTDITASKPCHKFEDITVDTPCINFDDISVSQIQRHSIYNNNNNNTNTCYTNQSIYQNNNAKVNYGNDGRIGFSEKEIIEIIKENNNAIPYSLNSNPALMKKAIYILTNCHELIDNKSISSDDIFAYKLIVRIIIKLATATKPIEVNHRYITYAEAIDRINDNILDDEGNPSLYDFLLSFFEEYKRIVSTYTIHNFESYMTSCIYNWLCVGFSKDNNVLL